MDGAIPSIPSVPLSYVDALPILKALNGHGPKADDFNQYWTRNTGLRYKGVEYHVGPTPDDVVVNLYNEQSYEITPLWNVIGVINGTISDEVISELPYDPRPVLGVLVLYGVHVFRGCPWRLC